MSLDSGRSKLFKSMKTLRERWDETREVWKDKVGQDFEEEHLEMLRQQVTAVLREVDRMDRVLARVEEECG